MLLKGIYSHIVYASSTEALRKLKFKTLDERRFCHGCLLVQKIKKKQIDVTKSAVYQYNCKTREEKNILRELKLIGADKLLAI